MILVVGLGPGDLDRVPAPVRDVLADPDRNVIVRTVDHPAAAQLSASRDIVTCDDLYSAETYEAVYTAIVDRVAAAAVTGPVVYAVPGSPLIGEFAVREMLARGLDVEILASPSFVDALCLEVGYDPLDRGLQVLNGHRLPDPLVIDKPTVIGHLDRPEVLADVAARLSRVLDETAPVTLAVDLWSADARVVTVGVDDIDPGLAGNRTSIFVDTEPGGLVGAIHTMRRLYVECPWDREQTHHSLVKNLVEETFELVEALSRLPDADPDPMAYAAVEDELGDLLLQILFHATIAGSRGVFEIDDVAETLRSKLVRRHPHVFGDVEAGTAAEVKRRWDLIKEAERVGDSQASILDGVPTGMSALHRASKVQNRAAKVGFDWERAAEVVAKVVEETDELTAALDGVGDVETELGDLLFTVVNVGRHLGLDPEIALQRANDRFETRFRRMEKEGPLVGLGLDEMNARWERAKD